MPCYDLALLSWVRTETAAKRTFILRKTTFQVHSSDFFQKYVKLIEQEYYWHVCKITDIIIIHANNNHTQVCSIPQKLPMTLAFG